MGSYSASANNGSGKTWRVREVYYEKGVRKIRTIPTEAYQALGINPAWTLEEAKRRCTEINADKQIQKKAITAAVARVNLEQLIESTYLPADLAAAFIEELRARSSVGNDKKLLFHWQFVQKLVVYLARQPHQYAEASQLIYRYLQDQFISVSYSEKILRVLNLWGEYVCGKQERYYRPVKNPTGVFAQRIAAAQRTAKPKRGASFGLTPELLKEIAAKLPSQKQVNWLLASIWFGLRPEEVNQLTEQPDNHRIENDGEVDILMVYQSKLMNIAPELRWKGIPVLFEEQSTLLPIIEAGELEQPLNKTLKAVTKKRVTGYGGRKGFVDLMLSLGQDLEDISNWMGHRSIERTWKSYKNKQKIRYKKPKRSA